MSVSSEQHASAKITCETHIHPIPHVHPAANYLRKMSMTMNIALKSPRFSVSSSLRSRRHKAKALGYQPRPKQDGLSTIWLGF
jgi:hypothetical protein